VTSRGDVSAGADVGDTSFERALAEVEAANRELAADLDRRVEDEYDVVVIGSGPGGGTLTYALRGLGASILLVERGDFLAQEPSNWDTRFVLEQQGYANSERWQNGHGEWYQPLHYYYVGGMSKLYAGTLLRFRATDFGAVQHEDGLSPAWPFSYEEVEPYYAEAERLYLAHGQAGEDPSEPPRSGPFPYPAVPVVPEVADLRDRLRRTGLHPFAMPQGLALKTGDGRCIYCGFCDSYPCRLLARGDTELCCIRPAIRNRNVTLVRNARACRLITDGPARRLAAVEVDIDGSARKIRAEIVVLAAGAVNSPVLLLRSADAAHPRGLANSSGLVGTNYMRHDMTVLMATTPDGTDLPDDHFWKSVGFNDFYLSGGSEWPYPLGTVQVIGNYHEYRRRLLPNSFGDSDEERSRSARAMLPLFLVTEDLPRADNRVTLTRDGHIMVDYNANNLASHRRLISVMRRKLQEAGFQPVTSRSFLRVEEGGGYHHCGTLRCGDDPKASVLDRDCRAHDVANLYVVDASCFPSSAACNPLLTIAANALRVADKIKSKLS